MILRRDNQKLAWSLNEVALALGISLNSVRSTVASGQLRTKRIGRRVLVLDEELKRYLSSPAVAVSGKRRMTMARRKG
jgi:excisionase family DNA binding protein